jgi:hypothetical protein
MKERRPEIDNPQTDTPRGQIAQRLQDAIHELHADVARVELWASALMSFAQPIPEYSRSKWDELNCADGADPEEPPTGH